MWKSIRIAVLLFVLLGVAVHSWLDRIATQGWKETLWVGIFPLNADGTPMAQRYVEGLTVQDFSGIEEFFAREAHRYAVAIEQPVHAELYPQGSELPPALAHDAGPLGIAWWSLKLRWFATHATEVPGRARETRAAARRSAGTRRGEPEGAGRRARAGARPVDAIHGRGDRGDSRPQRLGQDPHPAHPGRAARGRRRRGTARWRTAPAAQAPVRGAAAGAAAAGPGGCLRHHRAGDGADRPPPTPGALAVGDGRG